MTMSPKSLFLAQKHIPIVGVIRQLLGGAMTWITVLIFVFSALSAWNTSTMVTVRSWLPWLNMASFTVILFVGLLVALWLEHKWIQPSVMAYWNHMFYSHNNALRDDQARLEQKVDRIIEILNGDQAKHDTSPLEVNASVRERTKESAARK